AALAAEYRAIAPADFGEFLDSVDAVAFSVPPHVQAPLAVRAARAGKHLLLEKPVALAAEDADQLVAAVEEARVASVVFFTWRFNTEIRAWLTDEQARGGWSGEGWSGGAAIWLGTALQDDNPFDTPWRRGEDAARAGRPGGGTARRRGRAHGRGGRRTAGAPVRRPLRPGHHPGAGAGRGSALASCPSWPPWLRTEPD